MTVFNPAGSWMDNINRDLLERWWGKRGSPGEFRNKYGLRIRFLDTAYGDIITAVEDVIDGTRRVG